MAAGDEERPPFLQAPGLAALTSLRHGFFGREGGVSKGALRSLNAGFGADDAPCNVAENRRRIAAALGLNDPERLLSAYQVHSDRALIVDAPFDADKRPQVDALVTTTPGLAVGVVTADCAPVLLADAEAGVIAAAHAGWRGALSGVLEDALEKMLALGARIERMRAAVGPCIWRDNYEVGPEFVARFAAEDPSSSDFFHAGAGDRAQFDLPGYVTRRLARAGLTRIEALRHCTYGEAARYFSHRRGVHAGETDYGRNFSAVMIAP